MIEQLKSVLAGGGAHIGDLLWWTLSNAAIDRSTLESQWASAALAAELFPEAPTAEKALRTAVREAALGQHDRLIRLGKESETEIVFAVVREAKHSDGSVTYAQETRIIFDRKVETVSSDLPDHELGTVVAHRFGELRATHTSDDARRTVVRAIGTFAAVALRAALLLEPPDFLRFPFVTLVEARQLNHEKTRRTSQIFQRLEDVEQLPDGPLRVRSATSPP